MIVNPQTIDLSPPEANLILYQGDDRAFSVAFPNTVTVAGTTAKWQIKARDGSTVLTLQSGSGISLSGRVFTVTVTKAQSTALPTGRVMFHDFQWTDLSSKDVTLFTGTVQVKPQRTT